MFGEGYNQVFFMKSTGEVYRDPVGAPVVRCAIPRETKRIDDTYHMDWSGEDWRVVWALVDTGADKNYIDVEFSKRLGLKPKGTLTVQGATATEELPYFEDYIYLVGAKQIVTGEFASAKLLANGRHYPLVIGSELLLQGVLILDRWSGTFIFDSLPKDKSKK